MLVTSALQTVVNDGHMSEHEGVEVEHKGVVWVVAINRPARRNAVDAPTARTLLAAFEEFDADPRRVLRSSLAATGRSAPEPTCRRSPAASGARSA